MPLTQPQPTEPQVTSTHSKDALGRYGEAIAARCLTDSGHRLIEVNWRCARGEIDIIAADGRTLVICEVKTRSSLAFGEPAEAVDEAKSRRVGLAGRPWVGGEPRGRGGGP